MMNCTEKKRQRTSCFNRFGFGLNLRSGFRGLLSALIYFSALQSALAAEFYVSPVGSDLAQGSKEHPFQTLECARDAIRDFKENGQWDGKSITVWLEEGNYHRTHAFELTEADSGTKDGAVVWRAVEREKVRLTGGRLLVGFRPVTDESVLERLSPEARRHVLECDLERLGIENDGRMQSRGFGRETTPAHSELFFDDSPMTVARWPNEGEWTQIAGFPGKSAKGDGHGGELGSLIEGFFYDGDRPRRWHDPKDLWVHGYWAWDWANSYERVAQIDTERRYVTTAEPHGLYGFRKGQRFYFLNVLEELDQAGEWFLDRSKGRLYFWPPGPMEDGKALLSLIDQPLLRFNKVSHVTFRDITLEATRANAVEISGGDTNLIVACLIRNVGNYGVKVDGGHGHGVVACDIFDTGDGGVDLVGGDRKTLTPGGHYVDNCHFRRQGRWSKCYVPAIHMKGVGHRVSHSLIHDHPHCAILFSGNDHAIEFNEISHIAMETGDVGAIYSGRDYTYRGNRIRHNYIHHTSTDGNGGSMGVYMDDCVSGTEIYGNIFYKVHWAVFLGGGRDHLVENNLFVDCDPTLRMDGRGLDPSSPWRNNVDKGMRQSLRDMPSTLYRKRYPALKQLDAYYGAPGEPALAGEDFKGVPPENNVVTRNVCVGGKWLDVSWFAQEDQMKIEDNWVGRDPGFKSEGKKTVRDFSLENDSAVFQTGFRAIPVEKMGLREDEYRKGPVFLNHTFD